MNVRRAFKAASLTAAGLVLAAGGPAVAGSSSAPATEPAYTAVQGGPSQATELTHLGAFALAGVSPSSSGEVASGQCPYQGSHPTLRYDGGNSYAVATKHAQCLWNVQNARLGGTTRLAEDGYFGPGTQNMMYRIQTACGIASDGIVGPNTWKCLHPDQSPNPLYLGGIFPVG